MKIPSVKGFHDVLPGESRALELDSKQQAREVFARYNFARDPHADRRAHRALPAARSARPPTSSRRRCTPSPTATARSLTLRPEGTASVVRAYVEHALHAARAGVEALLLRARCSAASGRRRGACGSSRRSAPRCSAATTPPSTPRCCCCCTTCSPTSAIRGAAGASSTRSATRPAGRRIATRCVAFGEAHRDRAVRGLPRAASSSNPLRLLDCKVARLPRRDRRRAAACSITCATPCRAHFDARARAARRARACASRLQPAHGARPRLLRAHRVRGGRRGARARRTRVGGGGRYDGLVNATRRAATSPASASRSASSAWRSCSMRRRTVAARAAARVRHRAARRRGRGRGAARWRTAGAAPACASRSSQRRTQLEEPDAPRRQARRAAT